MFHSFDDHVLLSNEDGKITNIMTNSKIDYIVMYGTSIQRIWSRRIWHRYRW